MPALLFEIRPNNDGESFNIRAFECKDVADALKKMKKLEAKAGTKKKKNPAKKQAKKKPVRG